jgi:ABC-type multidrug transport system fused ATPase/permease subunit
VLHHGQVIESGRHDELLERRGAYADLYAKQAKGLQRTAPLAAVATYG